MAIPLDGDRICFVGLLLSAVCFYIDTSRAASTSSSALHADAGW